MSKIEKIQLEKALHLKRSQLSKIGWQIRRLKDQLGVPANKSIKR